jgi:hypothetical protein
MLKPERKATINLGPIVAPKSYPSRAMGTQLGRPATGSAWHLIEAEQSLPMEARTSEGDDIVTRHV